MEKRFLTTREVAAFLCVSVRTLYNYASRHAIFRPSRPGVWHVEHVKILEKVWSNAVTEDEGVILWEYEKMRMRRVLKFVMPNASGDVKLCSKSK